MLAIFSALHFWEAMTGPMTVEREEEFSGAWAAPRDLLTM
jgi:hypothetical protein